MAYEEYKPVAASGSYGESGAYAAVDYLKKLRAALDAGQISVSDFIRLGKPAAETGYQQIYSIASSGNKAADSVAGLFDQIGQSGFTKGSDGKINPKLPDQYQQKIREEILPANISKDERDSFINDIPSDIDLLSDRGTLEREALRTKFSNNRSISSLSDLLANENTRQFELATPGIEEDLNSQGLLHSTALGEALAREKAKLVGQSDFTLGQAKLASDQQVNDIRLGGVSRQFSLDDFAKQTALARELAQMQIDSSGKSSGGNPLAGALTGGLNGAVLGGSVGGPWGAVAGGAAGAAGGAASQKGGGK